MQLSDLNWPAVQALNKDTPVVFPIAALDNTAADWGFYLELRDPATHGPLQGTELRATPP